MIKPFRILSVLMIASVVPAACSPSATLSATSTPVSLSIEATPATPIFGVGEVTDLEGMQAGSFNANAYAGIQDAIAQFGIQGQYLISQQSSDYAKNIQQFLNEDMDLIIIVGSLAGVDTAVAAKAYPDRKFAIVEAAYPDCSQGEVDGSECGPAVDLPNVRQLTFQTDEAAFLAGYLAAGLTVTGKIGTYGGSDVPGVTTLMKGFESGAKYYNAMHGTHVEVKGGLSEVSGGLFTGNFTSTEDGRAYAESLVLQSVDILMPVAGPAGLGSAAVCQETGLCWIIGVDTDWFISAPQYREVVLTSILKKLDVAVYDTIIDALDGRFTGGTVVYTIKDGAVDLAPFHDLDDKIPFSLKSEIEDLKELLSDGSLSIDGIPNVEK